MLGVLAFQDEGIRRHPQMSVSIVGMWVLESVSVSVSVSGHSPIDCIWMYGLEYRTVHVSATMLLRNLGTVLAVVA